MKGIRICVTLLIAYLSQQTYANTFKTEQWQTTNGVKVVFYQAMEVPMLDISLAFAAGSAYDKNQFGLSALTSRLLDQGSRGENATQIAEALADEGSQFSSATSRDMSVLNLRTLTSTEALSHSIDTFAKIIAYPDFPQTAFDREKKQLGMAIMQSEESPDDVASTEFFKTLYKGHPYAHPVEGTKESLNSISRTDVQEFYKKHYVGSNAVLVLVGAIDSQKAHEIASTLTKNLPKGRKALSVPKAMPLANNEHISIPFPSSQTVLRLGQLGIDHHNPDYFPLLVGNYILGGGSLVSRLAVEVREKRGLSYGVDSQFLPMPGDGPFIISLSTKNSQASNALKVTEDTLDEFIHKGPENMEIDSAKDYLTGSFPMSLAGNRNIANLLLRMTFYQMPEHYLDNYVQNIQAVTKEQIIQAFNKQIKPKQLLLVRVGQS